MVDTAKMPECGPETLPLVAIVTPVYNGVAYLEETMEAVQAQDYPRLVHIVLDNASTDGTPEIIERYRNRRVPVHTRRNARLLPLLQNWNAAVALVPVEARYFRTLAADDTIAQSFISRTVEVAEHHPSVGVVGSLFNRNRGETVDLGWPAGQHVLPGRTALEMHFRRAIWLPSSHVLFRAGVIDRQRPFFPDKIIAFDLAATMDVLTRYDLGLVHEDLAMTRLHKETVSSVALDRERRHLYEQLHFISQYAPYALGAQASEEMRLLYRRHYLRQLLKWRLGANHEIYETHMRGLDGLGLRPEATQFADALWDWALVRLGRRAVWQGYPF